jgi:hypothetical protein
MYSADLEIGTHCVPILHPGKKAMLCTANPKFDKLTTREYKGGNASMPTISIFYGIVIQMFWSEHAPPHFHAFMPRMRF